MSLIAYKKKRSFTKTTEPTGGKSKEQQLRFVVQKHAASHLHYDFRLEMDGVLKSWAVPKGPSTDPEMKRLAMMVEDHPYDYRNFEGVIPKGEYGGGTVIVWDEGTYEPIEAIKGKKKQEKYLLETLKSGSLKVVLHGKKLKGEFALVKTHGMGENAWLLIKHQDRYAAATDILQKDKSVISRKTIEQMTKAMTSAETPEKVVKKLAKVVKDKASRSKQPVLKGKTKTPFYDRVKPMLATLVDEPIDDDDWLYEIKWDGYRAVAFMNKQKIALKSRNDQSFETQFFPIYQALKEWKVNAIVDGEVVVVDERGLANFSALQNWKSETDGHLLYYVFDILWYEGHDLTALPLMQRKELLAKILPKSPIIQLSKTFEVPGTEMLAAVKKMGLEGVMAKRKDSRYEVGLRTGDWLKIKSNQRQEVVIGGYTKNEGSSKPFSSLLVGVYKKGKLRYTGKVGTGFSLKKQEELLTLFKPLIVQKAPFEVAPDLDKPHRFRPNPSHAEVTWLKAKLICEVSFTEMTPDGLMRHPSFEGMRADKKAKDVVMEKEHSTKEVVAKEKGRSLSLAKGAKLLLHTTEDTQVYRAQQKEVKLNHLNKIYWPIEKISKRELINYYDQVAPFILPYLKNRPQSLNRHPNGINEPGFYQKDVTGKVPDWIDTYLYHTEESEEDKHFLLGNNKATLLYMANLGCIEINPWSSTIKKPDSPTWCVIDLDPDKHTFDQVIETAQVTKQILDEMKVESYCKTSGSTGLHIYIPLGAKYSYEQSKEFARIVVTLVQRQLPQLTTIERTVNKRKGKIYLDFLQNRAQATLAAPYSVRPKPGATVSMPLHWDEVKKGLKMKDFTIFNALQRLDELGDIFKPVLGKGIDLKKVIKAYADKET